MDAYLRYIGLIALSLWTAACAAGSTSTSTPSPAGVASPTGAPIGTWTATLTADDLRAAGFTDSATIQENAGPMILTYAPDGSWTHALDTEVPVRWPVFRGTSSVTGTDTIEMRTTFPTDFAGEIVRLRWSMDGEALRLMVIHPPDPLIRAQFETHPWLPQP